MNDDMQRMLKFLEDHQKRIEAKLNYDHPDRAQHQRNNWLEGILVGLEIAKEYIHENED